jgi:hypothetical protein
MMVLLSSFSQKRKLKRKRKRRIQKMKEEEEKLTFKVPLQFLLLSCSYCHHVKVLDDK